MAAKKAVIEKPKPLGDRVLLVHRKMLKAIARTRRENRAASLRFLIEEGHARLVGSARR